MNRILVAASNQKGARSAASLSDQAYYMIRERILRGQLPLGAVLSRRKLATEFGMSLLPVSEALQRLENDGLVESQPRAGTRVRTPTEDEVRGRYVVREAREAESAKLCCINATFQQRLEMRRMAEHFDTLYARARERENDTDFFYIAQEHHVNLHMRIAEYARCPELREAIERTHILIYNWFFDASTPGRSLPQGFHSELIEKVTGDDPEAADRAMREHVRFGLDSVLEHLARAANATDWRRKRDESA
jgi:GntR family transcriptional regulator, rspAB operon transcriptional repressor